MASDDKRVSDLLDDYQRQGLYGFDRSKLDASLPVSTAAVSKALARLAEKGRVRRLRKGFHAIVPVEYAAQGLPPFD
jgi:predicted transcriptional regulator of viral defense system